MRTNKVNQAVRRSGRAVTVLALSLIAACVTVNVNFPESAVQRAADDFVRDLYKGTTAVADANAKETATDATNMKKAMKKKSTSKMPASTPTENAKKPESKPTSFKLELFSSAYAIELNTSTPKALELRKSMAGRVSEIAKWKDKGVICETQDGMLKLAPGGAAKANPEVMGVMKDENKNREDLYDEIKGANRMGTDAPIRKSFAGAFRENSPAQGKCD